MTDDGLTTRLAETIANIEERTDSELSAIIKETLVAVGTGLKIDDVNEQYRVIHKELDRRYQEQNLHHPNPFSNLWDFYDYWKENNLSTYAARRSYIRKLYDTKDDHDSFWEDVHPVIRDVAKSRFDSHHHADAVEASFKEINSRIKEIVRQRTGKILDGAALMNHAFSLKNPVIQFDDLETEDGQNIQNGLMQMFSGAMTAVRNPPAHSNIDIEPDEAKQYIQLASFLFSKFEDAINREEANSTSTKADGMTIGKGVYVRIKNADEHEKLIKLKELAISNPGEHSLVLVLGTDKKSAIRLPYTVSTKPSFVTKLTELLGAEENVVVKR